ncbi:DUF1491 family protein [uncultured Maricaulis sp.]|uniref:DUF1491 family protein n=1 Tax=uncultured Maricaulis sp. TaxID=174710 RepID=UPI0030DC56A7|tara:strand:+ start:111269 stop:111610 length:342 start_codon:yes stop_codon:yes gene_type:complete
MKMIQLKTKLWVDALLRRAEIGLASAYVIRHGDEDAGAVLLKVANLTGQAALFVPARDENGDRIWTRFRDDWVAEAEVDTYCRRRADGDPDIWVVEIEDRKGRNFLTEPVADS